jgi:hypothetical protein
MSGKPRVANVFRPSDLASFVSTVAFQDTLASLGVVRSSRCLTRLVHCATRKWNPRSPEEAGGFCTGSEAIHLAFFRFNLQGCFRYRSSMARRVLLVSRERV